ESLESLTRYKRQLRNSQKRQQARYRQNQQRQAQKSRQRQRNSLHYRQQRQPRISPAAMRRAREKRKPNIEGRMMAAHARWQQGRSHKAAESAKSNAMKESPKQEVATSKTLTEEEAYLAKLEEERKKNEKDPSDGKGSNEDKGSEEN
uniref:4F5 domain-containing protein n=1 Tax=Strongyloides stercoralis TaxID=6248 RepID=A0A0K0EMS2_STRER